MANISKEKIEVIINKADIVSIVSSYLKLQKKGRNYWGICPFHQDSSPSMSVSPEKKIFKCFSCQVAGNVIDFVKDIEKIDFLSALKKVAESANVVLDELKEHKVKDKYSESQKKIFLLNEEAKNFFKTILFSEMGKGAYDYLISRNISNDDIAKFNIGFSSKKVSLVERLIEKGYTKKEIEEAGLGTIYDLEIKDYFVQRIIFPIKNEDGKIIGFSARALNDEKPKYINSRENEVFKKSKLAYNIQSVIRTATLKKEIIVLEGFMDVISLESIGVDNSIAIMGTSLSQYHIDLFKKMNVEVKLFLDGDLPGINATIKAAKALMSAGVQSTVIENDTKKDPDELIKEGKTTLVIQKIQQSVHPINFVIKKMWLGVDSNNPDSIIKYLTKVAEFIKGIANPILVEKSINDLIIITGFDRDVIQEFIKNDAGVHKEEKKNVTINQKEEGFIPQDPVIVLENSTIIKPKSEIIKSQSKAFLSKNYEMAEQRLFLSLLKSDEYKTKISRNLDYIIDPTLRSAMRGTIQEYDAGNYKGGNPKKILSLISDRIMNYEIEINSIVNSQLLNREMSAKEVDDAISILTNYVLENEIKKIQLEFKSAKTYNEKIAVMERLDRARKRLKRK